MKAYSKSLEDLIEYKDNNIIYSNKTYDAKEECSKYGEVFPSHGGSPRASQPPVKMDPFNRFKPKRAPKKPKKTNLKIFNRDLSEFSKPPAEPLTRMGNELYCFCNAKTKGKKDVWNADCKNACGEKCPLSEFGYCDDIEDVLDEPEHCLDPDNPDKSALEIFREMCHVMEMYIKENPGWKGVKSEDI